MVAEADDRRLVLFAPMMRTTTVVAPLGTRPSMCRLMAGAMLLPCRAALRVLTRFALLLPRHAVLFARLAEVLLRLAVLVLRLAVLPRLAMLLLRLTSLPRLVLRFGALARARMALPRPWPRVRRVHLSSRATARLPVRCSASSAANGSSPPSAQSILRLISFSMSSIALASTGVTIVKDAPSLPARPVRPILCT